MNQELKFEIYGIPKDGDEAIFEIFLLQTTIKFLLPLMGWVGWDDAGYSYLLTPEQLSPIEENESIELPRELDLYISSYV